MNIRSNKTPTKYTNQVSFPILSLRLLIIINPSIVTVYIYIAAGWALASGHCSFFYSGEVPHPPIHPCIYVCTSSSCLSRTVTFVCLLPLLQARPGVDPSGCLTSLAPQCSREEKYIEYNDNPEGRAAGGASFSLSFLLPLLSRNQKVMKAISFHS